MAGYTGDMANKKTSAKAAAHTVREAPAVYEAKALPRQAKGTSRVAARRAAQTPSGGTDANWPAQSVQPSRAARRIVRLMLKMHGPAFVELAKH